MHEAYPRRSASARHGASFGSVPMFFAIWIWPVRMQVPVGPRPRSESAQVMFAAFRYPSSNPACAMGRTVRAASPSA